MLVPHVDSAVSSAKTLKIVVPVSLRRTAEQSGSNSMTCKAGSAPEHIGSRHIHLPSHSGRAKRDVQVPASKPQTGGVWNTAGLPEAGKMRSIVYLMKQCKLDKLALTETHMKQQGQYVIKGYTFSRAAHEVFDEKNTAQQTFTGVSLVTAPHITLAVVDPTTYNGRVAFFYVGFS